MLRAGAEPGAEERRHEQTDPRARARETVPDTGERRAKSEEKSRAEPLSQQPRWNLEACHGAGEQGAQEPKLGITKPELLLPDRQQHIDQIGIAVVQRVRAAGDAPNPTLLPPAPHPPTLGTKLLPA